VVQRAQSDEMVEEESLPILGVGGRVLPGQYQPQKS
jgi:hypothetical protein